MKVKLIRDAELNCCTDTDDYIIYGKKGEIVEEVTFDKDTNSYIQANEYKGNIYINKGDCKVVK